MSFQKISNFGGLADLKIIGSDSNVQDFSFRSDWTIIHLTLIRYQKFENKWHSNITIYYIKNELCFLSRSKRIVIITFKTIQRPNSKKKNKQLFVFRISFHIISPILMLSGWIKTKRYFFLFMPTLNDRISRHTILINFIHS